MRVKYDLDPPEVTETARKQAQASNAQARAKVTVAQTARMPMSRARLQEALMWTEILGEPKCRQRHPRQATKRTGR